MIERRITIGAHMSSPALAIPVESLAPQRPLPAPPSRILRIGRHAGAWHMSEDGTNTLGGIFTSLPAAVTFGRDELRDVRGAVLVIELDGGSRDEAPDTTAKGTSTADEAGAGFTGGL
jgi:hypothetical protein